MVWDVEQVKCFPFLNICQFLQAEIETHVHPGSLSLYVHYGHSRPKDAKSLAQSDVVITTYGILASEFSSEVVETCIPSLILPVYFISQDFSTGAYLSYVQNADDNGGLFSIRWFRVVLDEAHTIKSSKSQVSVAAGALIADRRWCLTGTPIQVNYNRVFLYLMTD